MKIIVYAIARNEEKFVLRWCDSIKDADEIYVLDTGSTDKTVELLRSRGVIVKQEIINPWRFDVARNKSLEMVHKDADICICLDLDEVMLPGWRQKLINLWKKDTTRISYTYNWALDKEDKPIVSFYASKIHARNSYKWTHPVHEVLFPLTNENVITTDEIIINHYPDSKKSRSSYLPLLELSVMESPEDDRNMHYLGREYMYYGKWDKCIETLIKHLNLKSATWNDERCASMRFIARSYQKLGRYDEAVLWGKKAIKEAPYLRDPYMELALIEFHNNNYEEVIINCTKALRIIKHPKTYINESFSWDNTVYDLLSIAYYYIGIYDLSLYFLDRALLMNSNDERLIKNRELIVKKIKEI